MVRINKAAPLDRPAIGGLTLMSPNPARRYEAARAVFKSREAAALPGSRARSRRKTSPRIQAGAGGGARRIILNSEGASAADKGRGGRRHPGAGDQDAVGLLQGIARRHAPAVVTAQQRDRRHGEGGWPSGSWRRTPGTGSRSARCC